MEIVNWLGMRWPVLNWPPHETLATLVTAPSYATALLYFLCNLALVALALLIGLGIIAALLKNTRPAESKVLPGAIALLAISSGLAVMLGELFLLALLQVMTAEHVAQAYAVTGALALGSCTVARHHLGAIIPRPLITWGGCVTVVVVALLLVCQMASISIPGVSDSTSFHAPYADVFFRQHGLAVDLNLIYPYHSFNINIFYSLGLMLHHDLVYLQSMHALFATLSMFGIYIFCRVMGQRTFIAVALAFIFVELYIIRFARFQANVDLGAMFFVLAAVLGLYLWSVNRSAVWLLICSAIAFGIAMGTKYIIVVIAVPIALTIAIHKGRHMWRPLFTYIAWAACFGLWWYIRNWICTGNPVHPFANSIFGYYLWDAKDMAAQMEPLSQSYLPRNLAGFVAMPMYAWQNIVLWTQSGFTIVALLYVSTLLSWLLPRHTNYLLVFCWIYLVSWMFGSQDPRHLMPAMPLVFIYVGAVINALWSNGAALFGSTSTRPLWLTLPGTLLAVTLTVVALAYGAINTRDKFVTVYYEPLQINQENVAWFRSNPIFDLFYAANEIFTEDETVYEFDLRDGRWYFKGHLVGTLFGPNGYYRVMNKAARPEVGGMAPELLEKVLREDYTAHGFLIPNDGYPYVQSEFDAYFQLMYRNSLGSIYRLRNP